MSDEKSPEIEQETKTENQSSKDTKKQPETNIKTYTNEEGQLVEEHINISDNTTNYKKINLITHENNPKTHALGRVWINIKGTTKDGLVFEDYLFDEKSFILGQNKHALAIEMALATMHIGDHCCVYVYNSKYSFSNSCTTKPIPYREYKITKNWDKYNPIKFDLILVDCMERQKDSHEMKFDEQLKYCNILKDKGNKRYEQKKFKTALDIYNMGIQCIEAMNDIEQVFDDDFEVLNNTSKDDVLKCKENLYLNASICELRLKNWQESIKLSTKAIKLNDDCIKGYIRRSICFYRLSEYNNAKIDIKKYLKLCKNDKKQKKIGNEWLNKIINQQKIEFNKQKKIYGGFLDKSNAKNVELYNDKNIINNIEKGYVKWLYDELKDIIIVIPKAFISVFNEIRYFCCCKKIADSKID